MYILYTLVFARKQRNLGNVNSYKKPKNNFSKREKPIVSKIIEFNEKNGYLFNTLHIEFFFFSKLNT
jgi:hypothetical protein